MVGRNIKWYNHSGKWYRGLSIKKRWLYFCVSP